MYKVKIFGAGSIGNHLAHASRSLGWAVIMCDVDQAALDRTRDEIYPSRYGAWDKAIELYLVDNAPKERFDVIVVGTPPDSHLPIAEQAIQEHPKALLIEKPLCPPGLEGMEQLYRQAETSPTRLFVGYDHVVGKAAQETLKASQRLKGIETIDVEFREFWGGIFAAHPWLEGPQDTYLGFWKRGGGASGEHSHAINLWQFFAHELNLGRVSEVSALLEYNQTSHVDYDKLCLLHLKTEKGLIGRVVQDVITSPPKKWARIQGTNGYVELTIGIEPGVDQVVSKIDQEEPQIQRITKTRPDDFIWELQHIDSVLQRKENRSPIALERGLETMMVVSAAHLSHTNLRTVRIDYEKGHSSQALAMP